MKRPEKALDPSVSLKDIFDVLRGDLRVQLVSDAVARTERPDPAAAACRARSSSTRLGIRHEDTVVVTESGCENLAPKQALLIDRRE